MVGVSGGPAEHPLQEGGIACCVGALLTGARAPAAPPHPPRPRGGTPVGGGARFPPPPPPPPAPGDFAAELLPGDRVLALGGESGDGKPGSNEHAMHHVDVRGEGGEGGARCAVRGVSCRGL